MRRSFFSPLSPGLCPREPPEVSTDDRRWTNGGSAVPAGTRRGAARQPDPVRPGGRDRQWRQADAAQIHSALLGFFPDAMLRKVRYASGQADAITIPGLAMSYGHIDAVTLVDVILFRDDARGAHRRQTLGS